MGRTEWWLWILFLPGVVAAFVLEYRSRRNKANEKENER